MGDVQISNVTMLMEKIGIGDVIKARIAGKFEKIMKSTGDLKLSDMQKVKVDEGISKSKIAEFMNRISVPDRRSGGR
jgi:hypothetical protein